MPQVENLPAHIQTKIQVNRKTGCWEWAAAKNPKGYGNLKHGQGTKSAHRVVYELLVGEIPDNLHLDHICRNRSCVNPEHLEPVTNKTNLLRGEGWGAKNARKTHCMNGHEYTPENTLINSVGSRVCRICRAATIRKYYLSKKEE